MKTLFLIAAFLLYGGMLQAQDEKVNPGDKSFMNLQGGVSFPIGDFNSKNMDNQDAAFAKPGYRMSLGYEYMIGKGFGIAADVFYNSNKVKDESIRINNPETSTPIPVNMDHWRFYGVTAGAVYHFNVGEPIIIGFKITGGIANANAPVIKVNNVKVTNDEWSTAAVLRGGADCRFTLNNHLYVVTGVNYNYLDPTFKYRYSGALAGQLSADNFHQKMEMIDITAGIGFSF